MPFPLSGASLLVSAVLFGFIFGWLLHRARVTDTNVIVNQFRFRDFTVLKVMLTAILIGGLGVFFLHAGGLASYHIKPANLLGVALGAVLFGIGMVAYGYCPGSGLAAIGTGSLHALIGALGMVFGAVLFALSYDWVKAHILNIAALGSVRLPELTGIPDLVWFAGLAVLALIGFLALERRPRR
ncbi:MAG: YeeE/YedE family protein [Acidobacteriia bacterium]|nr:YeeE/YedE family protein [Methyloceanibacter sp.]MCL6492721.1 YeeE/YedE family protein [Terriglobia bacterium]